MMVSRMHLRKRKTFPRGEEDRDLLSYGESHTSWRERHASAPHKADSHERIPLPAETVPTGGPLATRAFPAAVTLPSQVPFIHGASPNAAPSTTSEALGASTGALLQAAWLHSSTSRHVGYIRAELLPPIAPAAAPSLVNGTRATHIVTINIGPTTTATKVHPLTAEQSPCARSRFRRVSYSVLLVLVWLSLKNCEERLYKGTRRSCLSDVPEDFSPDATSAAWWPRYHEGCGSVGGDQRHGRLKVETRSIPSGGLRARRGRSYGAAWAASPTVEARPSGPLPKAATPAFGVAVPLAVRAFFPAVGSARPLLVVTASMRVVLLVAASLLLDAGGADVPMPAGRAVISRPKGGGAGGAAAALGAAGTERTAAAPSPAPPAVNEAGGAAGWREKRGDKAKSGRHNDVVVARGAGAATVAAVAAAVTSVTTQEEGFAREGRWARSLRRRWGEQAYLDMVARTINGLESEHFWLAMLGKQLQLQSSKMHLKTQRIERHKLEQRRKKQAMAAFNQAQGKAEAAAAEYQRHQRRGGGGGAGGGGAGMSNFFRLGVAAGAGPGPRVITAGPGVGAKNEAELRFGELSLYTLDWVGPRTCAQLGWAAGNDVCALSLEIEIHVLHSRLLLKSVEVQDRQNRLFVCDSGAAFFRASAAALAKQEGSERQFYSTAGSRNSKKCRGCDRGGGGGSTAGSTTSSTGRGRDRSRETKGGTPHSPHTATTGVASVGGIPDAPLAFWDDQGGNGDDWTHGGGTRVGATGAAGVGGSKERGTTGVGADKRRGNRPPAGGGAGAGGAPATASSPSPARPQAAAGEKGKKGQQQPHHGGGADVEMKHQHHHVFSSAGEDGSAAIEERGTAGTTKKRRRPNKRKKKISSHNRNVAASLGTLHETFDWEAIAHNFYIPALADLQPPGRSMVENFTTELTYLMGVLDREESLRSGKPTAIASSLPHDQLRSPFVYSSMPLTGQALGADRAGADRYPGINFFPGAGGGQMRRPSPFDRKRTAAGGIAWAVESWPRDKGVASMQGALGAAAAAGVPGGTTFQGSTAGNRLQAPNVASFNSAMGHVPDPVIKRRPGGSHIEKAGEKGKEVGESLKDRNLFPLVRVTSPSRPFQRVSAPSLHGAVHALEDQQQQQPQTYPWRPAIPRSTRPQQVSTRPDQGKLLPAPVLPTHQAPNKQQQDALAEGDGRLRTRHAYGPVREGERAPAALPEANGEGSVLVRNQNWWNQVTAGARGEEGMRQANSRMEPEAKVYKREEPELKHR